MFCYQCEQTKYGSGCTNFGVCGKTAETSDLQDVLLHAVKTYATGSVGVTDPDARGAIADRIHEALFATLTNVNFDADDVVRLTRGVIAATGAAAGVSVDADRAALLAWAAPSGIEARTARFGADVTGLQELVLYGLKGVAAYAHHARQMGRVDVAVDDFMLSALARLDAGESDVQALLALALACGEAAVGVLALLDDAHVTTFGKPEPTPVRIGHVPGKAILVSGHDLVDLKALLEQTAGRGINVYTHGEMLPAHGYPELKKYPHLVGHFGGAWMRQQKEFPNFPGPIVMTTNCLQDPDESYAGRLFTRDVVAWPGIGHLDGRDFSAVIAAAEAAEGFTDDVTHSTHTVGFGHDAVLGIAGVVIDAVKAGEIKHFALIGGCDGSEKDRSYYTDVAAAMPKDWMILTLGCGKFRLVGRDWGTVAGLPRLLDMGQCNDSFSAIKVAQALADAFGCGLNDLPLSLVLSWFEQKAVAVLLALLHLGVRNIRIGPALPAFVTPTVLQVLVDGFGLKPIGDVEADVADMGKAA